MSYNSWWREESVGANEAQSDDAFNLRFSCEHGSCKLFTSWTITNPGRRFWGCRLWKNVCNFDLVFPFLMNWNRKLIFFLIFLFKFKGGCKYFRWYEDPHNDRFKELLIEAIMKKKHAEEKLDLVREENVLLKAENKSLKLKLHIVVVTFVFFFVSMYFR